jgi:putative ABC transport system ATP-binding protein
MEPILETRDVTRVFTTDGTSVDALTGMNLTIQPGEFVAIMGPSGSGKSTLLQILGGLDRPTSGELYLDGARVDELSEAQWAVRRRNQVSYVFQFFNLIQNLSAADNIELAALMAGLPSAEVRERRERLAAELDIADRMHLPPTRLSGGEQQRVAIARALVVEPLILLADEPTGNLDSASAREVLRLLERYHADGQTIVMVTHDPRVAAGTDRVVRMRDGRLASETSLSGERDLQTRLSELIELEA